MKHLFLTLIFKLVVITSVVAQCQITLTSATGSDAQSVCENSSINTITYSISATNAEAIGLPAGISADFTNNILTINGSLTPNALPGLYTYTVNASGGCSETVTGTIQVGLSTNENSGSLNQTICINQPTQTIILNVGGGIAPSIMWNGPNGSSAPTGITSGYTASTFTIGGTPTQAGTYTYTVITNGCTPQSQLTGTITVDALPAATAGGSKTICQDNSYTLQNGEASAAYGSISWTENGAGSLTNANTLTPTYTPAVADAGSVVTLTMTVTSTNTCGSQTANATYAIQVDPLPQVNVTGAVSICKGTSHTLSVGAATISNGTFAWRHNGQGNITNANTLTPTYNSSANEPGSTVTLTLTVTSNNTCIASLHSIVYDTYTIKVDSTPVAVAGGSNAICENGTYTLQNGEASAAHGSISWAENGAGSLTNANTLTPTYTPAVADAGSIVTLTMTVTSSNSCNPQNVRAIYNIQVDQLPQATLSGSSTICANESITIIGAQINNGYISWTHNGGGVLSNANSIAPTYNSHPMDAGSVVTLTMSVTSNNTCQTATASATYPITVRELPTASISGSTTLCEGDDATNITFTASGGIAPYTFSYSLNGGASQTISTVGSSSVAIINVSSDVAGTYTYSLLSASNANYCSQTQQGSATIRVNAFPCNSSLNVHVNTTNATSSVTCDGNATVSVRGGQQPYTIDLPYTTINDSTFLVSSLCAGYYTVQASDALNNLASFTFVVGSPENTYTNTPVDGTPTNTLVTDAIQNCVIDFDAVSSVFISSVELINNNKVLVTWNVVQGTVTTTQSAEYEYSILGLYTFILDVYCTSRSGGSSFKAVDYYDLSSLSSSTNPLSSSAEVQVYPNPVKEILYIQAAQASNISITNIAGVIVYSGELTSGTNTINTAALAPGMYIVSVRNESGVATYKVVK